MESVIKIIHRNAKISRAVAKSVMPDNLQAPPGFKIITKVNRRTTITKIYGKDLEAFIFIVDDLLQCIDAANNTLEAIEIE
ncbi:MAG: KEOPS complex subunit Pcc1 [Candidatus Bathyarchaeia archaeon]|nr:hypothetical protein [Candidatus Bathyarchaeota archaeon]